MVARSSKSEKKSANKKTKRGPGRPRKKPQVQEKEVHLRHAPVAPDTMRSVWAILFILLAVFFLLAEFNMAGKLGTTLYIWLGALFGVGYTLVPISFVLLAVVFFSELNKKDVSTFKIASTVIFFLSGLGLIETVSTGNGGLAGELVSAPLIYAVDTTATILVLCGLIIVTLLIAFDTHLQKIFASAMALIFKKEKEEENVLEEEEQATIDEHTKEHEQLSEQQNENEEDASDTDAKEKSAGIFNFGAGKADAEPSIFNFSSGKSGEYTPPPLSILKKDKGRPAVGDVKASANTIKRTLNNFGISVVMDEVSIGPTVTRYAMKPAEGVRLAKILSLQSNLELALAASPIRIEAPIPGKALVGIEVPNTTKSTLGLATLMSEKEFQKSDKPLLITLGRDITGKPHYANIAKMPHLLIAGATGAGKSVTVHDLIMSLLYRKGPQDLRFVMVDPKRVELTLYNSIPHLLTPVITDPKKAILALKWLAKEMDRRYDILEAEKVRDIASYHANIYEPAKGAEDAPEPMPYIVTVIDELSDLMQAYPRELESAIVRLAQMSRAVGIHLILSTQRPSVQVITGLIKANIPSRLALQVSSQIDSRTILDMGGAEKLLGAGDMLFLSGEMSKPRRIQAPFVTEDEVKATVKYLADSYSDELPDEIDLTEVGHDSSIFSATVGGSGSIETDEEDALYDEAKNIIIEAGKGSTSFLQRKLRIGYARAARLMDMLEENGIVGPQEGSKPREVIADAVQTDEQQEEYDDDSPSLVSTDTEPAEEMETETEDESSESTTTDSSTEAEYDEEDSDEEDSDIYTTTRL